MHVVPLPALADNYIWMLHDDHGNAMVVDPGDAEPVDVALAAQGLRLRAVLLTHHHADHIQGAAALRERHRVPIHAPRDKRIPCATHFHDDGDVLALTAPAARFDVLAVPGHTGTHLAYAGEGLLFCGDTLFSLGCGRLFEGTPAQMLASLDRLAALPGDTLMCCGHEYTLANGRFALSVEPANADLQARVAEANDQRAANRPSVPVTMDSERKCNPFLRIEADDLASRGGQHGLCDDRVARFAALRAAKDIFCE